VIIIFLKIAWVYKPLCNLLLLLLLAGATAPALGWHQLCQHHQWGAAHAAAAGAAAVHYGHHMRPR
jgi:hypothetical protein